MAVVGGGGGAVVAVVVGGGGAVVVTVVVAVVGGGGAVVVTVVVTVVDGVVVAVVGAGGVVVDGGRGAGRSDGRGDAVVGEGDDAVVVDGRGGAGVVLARGIGVPPGGGGSCAVVVVVVVMDVELTEPGASVVVLGGVTTMEAPVVGAKIEGGVVTGGVGRNDLVEGSVGSGAPEISSTPMVVDARAASSPPDLSFVAATVNRATSATGTPIFTQSGQPR